MRWIKEHKVITCVVAVLLVLTIICVISFSSGGSGVAGKSVNGAVTAEEQTVNSGVSGVKGVFRGILNFREISEENEALRNQIEELEKELLEAELTKEQLKQLKELSKALDYKAVKNEDVVAADIIAFDGSTWLNSFTINRGKKAGIEKGDVVVCGTGLAGRVIETGGNWAKVTAVVDENSKTSFTVKRDSDVLGMLYGDGKGELKGYVLDAESSISEGDTLLTTGMGMYPSGIEIGVVTNVEYNSDTQIKMVEVEPSVNFRSISKVAVIV